MPLAKNDLIGYFTAVWRGPRGGRPCPGEG